MSHADPRTPPPFVPEDPQGLLGSTGSMGDDKTGLTVEECREEAWLRLRAAQRYLREIGPHRPDVGNRGLLGVAVDLLQKAGEWLE